MTKPVGEILVTPEMNERLQTFIDNVDKQVSLLVEPDSLDAIKLFLHPSVEETKIFDAIGRCMQESDINKRDLIALSEAHPEYFGICICALDFVKDADDEIIKLAINIDNIGPVISICDKLTSFPQIELNQEEIYDLLLHHRNEQRDQHTINIETDALLLLAHSKFPGKTFESIAADLNVNPSEVGYNYMISRRQTPQSTTRLLDLYEFKPFIIRDNPELLVRQIQYIKDISPEDIRYILQNASNLFNNLENLPQDISTEIIEARFNKMEKAVRNQLLIDMVGTGRYKGIEILSPILNMADFQQEKDLVVSKLLHKYQIFLAEENFNDCIEQLNCLKDLGDISLEADREILQGKSESSSNEYIETGIFEHKKVTHEATLFYLYEWADFQIMLLSRKMRPHDLDELAFEPKEFLNIADTVRLNEIASMRLKFVNETFDWMHKYGVVAVNSEMTHQLDKDKFSNAHISELDIFSNELTYEEVRVYLEQAKYLFPGIQEYYKKHENMGETMGGEKWVSVAEICAIAWHKNITSKQKVFVIDQFFDLEHNTGHIFDKDSKLVSDGGLDALLKIKFGSSDPQDILRYAKENSILNTQELRTFTEIFETIQSMQNAPLRPAGYE